MADIRMPHLDGYAVAEQIRSAESRLSKIPLIALSNSPNRDAKRCEKAGFNGFLSKPVRRKKLFQMIDRILQQNNRPGDDTKISPKKIHTQYSVREELKHAIKILLAEDNPVNQRLTEIMLKNAGYKVTVVGDGTEAVDTFIADPENFDLIFIDIQMPEMDGKEATEKIRGKGFTQIPIIAMTAHAMAEDKKLCVDAGMNGYITKPIKRETVFAEIKKYVYRETVA
jgi:CheY-like chemotaxis protein